MDPQNAHFRNNNYGNNGYNYPPQEHIPMSKTDREKQIIMMNYNHGMPEREINYDRQISDMEFEIQSIYKEIKRFGKVNDKLRLLADCLESGGSCGRGKG